MLNNEPRILIVDDHPLVAEGLRRLLESQFQSVDVIVRFSEVLQTVQNSRPDIVLLDISMPGRGGIETARQIREQWPDIKIVFVTMHTEAVYVRQAMLTGAQGYVLKASVVSELLDAIRTVLAGKIFLSPLVERPEAPPLNPARTRAPLSPKQREVLQLVAIGRSDKEIAAFMNISVKTVEFHKSSIRQRLGLHSTAELIRYALEERMLTAAPD